MPGHAIPEPYSWDESFKVFYANLDDEHKGLFDGVFKCCKDNNKANFDSLLSLVTAHFKNEEGMMQAKKFSDFPGHKKMHDAFVAKAGALNVPLSAGDQNYIKDWLVQHIKDTDFKYKGKL